MAIELQHYFAAKVALLLDRAGSLDAVLQETVILGGLSGLRDAALDLSRKANDRHDCDLAREYSFLAAKVVGRIAEMGEPNNIEPARTNAALLSAVSDAQQLVVRG